MEDGVKQQHQHAQKGACMLHEHGDGVVCTAGGEQEHVCAAVGRSAEAAGVCCSWEHG